MFKTLTEEQLDTMLDKASGDFVEDIEAMNQMYKLPISPRPTLYGLTTPKGMPQAASERIIGFLKTLGDEIAEGEEIKSFLDVLENKPDRPVPAELAEKLTQFRSLTLVDLKEAERVVLTMMADWFADMVVYIRSEAMKFGIPLELVQQAVMASNFTKLPADGIPVHDENGKFLKDMTNYVPPESAIHSIIHDPMLYESDELDGDEDEVSDE